MKHKLSFRLSETAYQRLLQRVEKKRLPVYLESLVLKELGLTGDDALEQGYLDLMADRESLRMAVKWISGERGEFLPDGPEKWGGWRV